MEIRSVSNAAVNRPTAPSIAEAGVNATASLNSSAGDASGDKKSSSAVAGGYISPYINYDQGAQSPFCCSATSRPGPRRTKSPRAAWSKSIAARPAAWAGRPNRAAGKDRRTPAPHPPNRRRLPERPPPPAPPAAEPSPPRRWACLSPRSGPAPHPARPRPSPRPVPAHPAAAESAPPPPRWRSAAAVAATPIRAVWCR